MTEAKKPEPAAEVTPVGVSSTRTSDGKIVRKAPPGSRRAGANAAHRKGPFVKYVGEASHRKISAADWASLPGMVAPNGGFQPTVWEPKNDKMIECAAFSDEQLDYLLLDDNQPSGGHSFLEMDYDADGNLVQVVDEA
jgi:hypothetical protein